MNETTAECPTPNPAQNAGEAAYLLNVSQPALIRLLDEGKIEFHKVGTHRRVPFKSALAYKRQIDTERKAALAELAAYDQELGI